MKENLIHCSCREITFRTRTHSNTDTHTHTHNTARPKRWKQRKCRFWTDMWCCTRRNPVWTQRRRVRSSHPQIASCLQSQKRWWVNVKEEDRVRIICSRQPPRRHMRNFFSHRHRWKRTKPRQRQSNEQGMRKLWLFASSFFRILLDEIRRKKCVCFVL